MPTTTLSRQEQDQLYYQHMNERPSRHGGEMEQGADKGQSASKERYDVKTREERDKRGERSVREDKENRGNREHRRHRSDRVRSSERDHHDVEKKRHSQMPESAMQRAERNLSYQAGALQQPCGHYKPSDMSNSAFGTHDEIAHRHNSTAPYDPRPVVALEPGSIRAELVRSLERDYHNVDKHKHGHINETALQRAERQLSYQSGAVQQPCGHYRPSDMPIITFAIYDRILHRHDPNNPNNPGNANNDLEPQSGPPAPNRYPIAPDPAARAKEVTSPTTAPRSANVRSVAIDYDVVYLSEPSYTSITSPPRAHTAPARRSRSFRTHPQNYDDDGSKPLPAPPHSRGPYGQSPLDPELQPPYWMETIGHAIWTLVITFGHLFGTAATSILIVILGLIHCIMTSVLLVVGAVFDGLTTMLRIFFNLITCHFQSGEWGWEWTHLTRAWQWGRKSQWVWDCVGRVSTETEERDEKVARRLSLHEARKEEYKREQEEKAQMQAQNQLPPANKRHGVAALYGGRSMAYDLEKGYGPDQGPTRGPYY